MVQKDIPIEDQINRARRNILVHSILYYKYDENLISDTDYDNWGKRLIFLQERYPVEAQNTPFMVDEFKHFTDTTSGYDLPLDDEWGVRTANWLLRRREEREQENGTS